MNLPVEALEMEAPIRVRRFELRPNSGGAGTHRGGLGCVREFEILRGDVTVTYRGERHANPAAGSHGGSAGAAAAAEVRRANGDTETIPSKQVFKMSPGDRLTLETAGGGGYGRPEDRDSKLISADRRNGKITAGP
jgi:N-methylhydantoinase B